EAAAGVAGLVKAGLSLRDERNPENLNFCTLNPRIRLGGAAPVLAKEPGAGPPAGRPRPAGVGAVWRGGAHPPPVVGGGPWVEPRPQAPARSAELVVLSAKSSAALDAQAGRLAEHLRGHPELSLGDLAFSLATTRSALEHRLAFAAVSREALLAALDAAAQG